MNSKETMNGAAESPPQEFTDTERLDWMLCFIDGTDAEETNRRFEKAHTALRLGYRGRQALDVAMRMVFADDMSDEERRMELAAAKVLRIKETRDFLLGTTRTLDELSAHLGIQQESAEIIVAEAGVTMVDGTWGEIHVEE